MEHVFHVFLKKIFYVLKIVMQLEGKVLFKLLVFENLRNLNLPLHKKFPGTLYLQFLTVLFFS